MSMDDEVERYPYIQSLSRLIDNKLATFRQVQMTASLPCEVVDIDDSHTIVKVKFLVVSTTPLPIVQMPVFGPEFVRWPIGPGTLGVMLSASAALAFVDGLSDVEGDEGIATLAPPSNLGAGVFFPLGNKKNTATDDPKKAVIYGPDGVIIRDALKNNVIEVGRDQITIKGGRNGVVISNFDKSGNITIDGDGIALTYSSHTVVVNIDGVFIDGVNFLPHHHSGVMPGGGTSGPVSP